MAADTSERNYRMMDLMEWNVQDNEYSQFRLGICVDSFQAEGVFAFDTPLFRLPFVQTVLGRNLYNDWQGVTVDAGYTVTQQDSY